MSVRLGEAVVYLTGDSKGLEQSLDGAEKKTFNLGETIKKLAIGGMVVAGLKAGFDFLKGSIAAATEEQQGIALLGQAVKNTGADWDTASAAIEGYLASELKRTALDDGDGRAAIQKLTEATGDYQTALDLMGLTQDLARAKGIDLATAADIVGRVHEGNTGMLTRYGIVLEKGAGAQEALAAMQERFGGAAEAYGNTNQGAADKLNTAWGNVKETIGGALLPVIANFTTGLADLAMKAIPWVETAIGKVSPFFENLWGLVQKGIDWLGTLTGSFGNAGGAVSGVGAIVERVGAIWTQVWGKAQELWNAVWPQIQAVIGPIIADIQRILGNLAADAQRFFLDKFAFIKGWIDENMPMIRQTVETVMNAIRTVIEAVLGFIQRFWNEHGSQVLAGISQVWENIKTVINTALNTVFGIIKAIMQAINGDWKGAWETIKGVLTGIWEGMKKIVTGTLNAILGFFGTDLDKVLEKVRTFGANALTAIKKPFQTAYDWLVGLWNDIKHFIAHIFDNVKIPLPHFSVKWGEVLGVSIPTGVDVQWYGSGLDAIFNSPTLIGVGERGAERVQVTPIGASGSSGGSGMTIIYNDYRTGGQSNIEQVARGLEWQLRMQGA